MCDEGRYEDKPSGFDDQDIIPCQPREVNGSIYVLAVAAKVHRISRRCLTSRASLWDVADINSGQLLSKWRIKKQSDNRQHSVSSRFEGTEYLGREYMLREQVIT